MSTFKAILMRHGLTPTAVISAGFPKGTIWKYVYGYRWPKFKRILEFEKRLGIPREEFFEAQLSFEESRTVTNG